MKNASLEKRYAPLTSTAPASAASGAAQTVQTAAPSLAAQNSFSRDGESERTRMAKKLDTLTRIALDWPVASTNATTEAAKGAWREGNAIPRWAPSAAQANAEPELSARRTDEDRLAEAFAAFWDHCASRAEQRAAAAWANLSARLVSV